MERAQIETLLDLRRVGIDGDPRLFLIGAEAPVRRDVERADLTVEHILVDQRLALQGLDRGDAEGDAA